MIGAYARDILARLAKQQHTPVLMIDQSKVNDTLELLMVSVRLRNRAIPLFWLAKETKGGIGFTEQEKLLNVVKGWLPEGCTPMLAGDRFYGSADLVNWCQQAGWRYRLRLKGNLYVFQDQGDNQYTVYDDFDLPDPVSGSATNDTLSGSNQADALYGMEGDDTLKGFDGNDCLNGGAGNDTLDGGNGDDTLEGGAGDNLIQGGDGVDVAVYGHELSYLDIKHQADGSVLVTDTNPLTPGTDTLYNVEKIEGTDGTIDLTLSPPDNPKNNDILNGSTASDTLHGYDGADTLYGFGGNDLLYGDDGQDLLYGGSGKDIALGGDGDDLVYGNDGNDFLTGGNGNDTIDGGDNNDTIIGGFDSGSIAIVNGSAIITGGDTLTGGNGADLFKYSKSGSKDEGADVITDFQHKVDKLQLKGTYILADVVNGTFVDFGNHHGIIVENISKANLADDIVTLAAKSMHI